MDKKGKRYLRPVLLLLVTILFSALAVVVDRQAIGPEDTVVGFASLNGSFHDIFGYNAVMDTISDIMMYFSFLVVFQFAVAGIKRLVKRKSLSKVGKTIIGLGILYVIVAILYVAFDKIPINYRPVIQPGETELETSFPSTHTLVISTVMGSAIIAYRRLLSNKKAQKIAVICSQVVMVVGVAARLFAGVHWMTDIIAGILFSVTLVSFYSAWSADYLLQNTAERVDKAH